MRIAFPPPDDVGGWLKVERLAKALNTDGCTGVPDFFVRACWFHDVLYRLGRDLAGNRVTRRDADHVLRQIIQSQSIFGRFSPMAWWRWVGLRLLGGSAWRQNRKEREKWQALRRAQIESIVLKSRRDRGLP